MLLCAVCYFLHYTVFYYFHPISKPSIPECKSIFCQRNIILSGLVSSAQTPISPFQGLFQIFFIYLKKKRRKYIKQINILLLKF